MAQRMFWQQIDSLDRCEQVEPSKRTKYVSMYKIPCYKIESDSYLILNKFNLINNAGLLSSRMTKNQTTN